MIAPDSVRCKPALFCPIDKSRGMPVASPLTLSKHSCSVEVANFVGATSLCFRLLLAIQATLTPQGASLRSPFCLLLLASYPFPDSLPTQPKAALPSS